jgi:hypothetical protein
MAFPQSNPLRRAPRIRMAESVPAIVLGENGQRSKANLQTLSITGGMLRLSRALSQGDFVEVAFQTQSGKIEGLAEMLAPVGKPGSGILQPFRFIALEDDDHRALRREVDFANDRHFLEITTPTVRKSL